MAQCRDQQPCWTDQLVASSAWEFVATRRSLGKPPSGRQRVLRPDGLQSRVDLEPSATANDPAVTCRREGEGHGPRDLAAADKNMGISSLSLV